MATTGHPAGLQGLLRELQALGIEPVRHGRFLGLRGREVGKVPAALWGRLERWRPQLFRHLEDEVAPYRQRGFGR